MTMTAAMTAYISMLPFLAGAAAGAAGAGVWAPAGGMAVEESGAGAGLGAGPAGAGGVWVGVSVGVVGFIKYLSYLFIFYHVSIRAISIVDDILV